MTQKNIKIFINEIYSRGPKKNYDTNKTDVYHIDDTWSLDILDLKDYGPENNRGYRYVLVIIDNFSKFGWTIRLKNKNSQTKKNFFDKSNKIKPKFQINNLVMTADLKKTFSKGDTTNWSYKLYKITEIVNDTIPSYKINNLPERYNESLLKKTNLTLKENNSVMKKLRLDIV